MPVVIFLINPSLCFASELLRKEMRSGSFDLEFFVHIPSHYHKDLPTPMVLVFHGGGGHAQQIAKFSGFNKISEEKGFLVIYPEAINRHWNDGRENQKFPRHHATINDVAWIGKLIFKLQKTYSVDNKRIYAVGISNGGIFT